MGSPTSHQCSTQTWITDLDNAFQQSSNRNLAHHRYLGTAGQRIIRGGGVGTLSPIPPRLILWPTSIPLHPHVPLFPNFYFFVRPAWGFRLLCVYVFSACSKYTISLDIVLASLPTKKPVFHFSRTQIESRFKNPRASGPTRVSKYIFRHKSTFYHTLQTVFTDHWNLNFKILHGTTQFLPVYVPLPRLMK